MLLFLPWLQEEVHARNEVQEIFSELTGQFIDRVLFFKKNEADLISVDSKCQIWIL